MTTAADYKQILFDQQGRVAIVTLNRPERLNAWTYEMGGELMDAVERCNEDRGVGAIVVTGAGRGFCAGADMRGFQRGIDQREQGESEAGQATTPPPRREPPTTLFRRSKPIIAAINGPAIGVGLTITLNMDVRIASDQARLSMRFVRVGIVPELASTTYLPQIVGLSNALELALTARIVSADEALRYGLVSRVVPHEQLLPAVMTFAAEIADNPIEQVMATKAMIHRHMVEQDLAAVMKREGKTLQEMYSTANHKEAVKSFLEKREPQFNQE